MAVSRCEKEKGNDPRTVYSSRFGGTRERWSRSPADLRLVDREVRS